MRSARSAGIVRNGRSASKTSPKSARSRRIVCEVQEVREEQKILICPYVTI